ncbi:Hypothetical predicted protein [Paramuricea clavata]|uniref:Uncharacterized protein n=1 Tax=Paramuricea clavata TaxID=317549 RepID=A0A6S7H4X8_PARCT|nr:Hypothetical predicted protein [Paramuricea clavata]
MNGKIPAKQDMEMILDKALLESNCPSITNTYHRSKQTGSRKRGNPAKDSLERLDTEFPISKRTGCSFTSDAHDEVPQSQILNTAPRDEGEEAEQLAIVMRESTQLEQMTESEGKENDKAVVEKYQDIEVNSDDSYAAASLLMNMATHHTHN